MADDGSRPSVVAVLTAFRPTGSLRNVVASARAQVDRVVVVDNTPEGDVAAPDVLGALPAGVEVQAMGYNSGLAAALNAGIARHPDAGAYLLLDQDSSVPPDMVARLASRLNEDPSIGVVGPAPWDARSGRFLDPRTDRRPDLADLGAVITSGMLVRRGVLDQVAPFRDDFFVDCVDQEFCLRVRAAGWRVTQDKTVLLPHELGETRWHGRRPFRVRATHHPTWRLYWIGRNSAVMLREHWRSEPAWCVQWTAIVAYWAATIALVEPPRAVRLRTLAAGLRDGALGRAVPRERRPDVGVSR